MVDFDGIPPRGRLERAVRRFPAARVRALVFLAFAFALAALRVRDVAVLFVAALRFDFFFWAIGFPLRFAGLQSTCQWIGD